jgi:mannosyl-oligosaccharide alpha-1,2-mannosidase
MVWIRSLAQGACILSLAIALPTALPTNDPVDIAIDTIVKRQSREPADRAQAVVNTFKLSWEGYYKYAFPNDELKPVTNGFSNSRYDLLSFAFRISKMASLTQR